MATATTIMVEEDTIIGNLIMQTRDIIRISRIMAAEAECEAVAAAGTTKPIKTVLGTTVGRLKATTTTMEVTKLTNTLINQPT